MLPSIMPPGIMPPSIISLDGAPGANTILFLFPIRPPACGWNGVKDIKGQ
jgi:hypothetical protein